MNEMPRKDEETANVAGSASGGLTSIGARIHCPTTRTSGGENHDELDDIAIDNFLSVLAEVALAIAARKNEQDKNRDG